MKTLFTWITIIGFGLSLILFACIRAPIVEITIERLDGNGATINWYYPADITEDSEGAIYFTENGVPIVLESNFIIHKVVRY